MSDLEKKNIGDFFDRLPQKFNILEDQIDINVQLDYFESSKKIKDNLLDNEIVYSESNNLYDLAVSNSKKKQLLQQLACIDEPKAYRLLEEFVKTVEGELSDWAKLALFESRTLLQGTLLDESQVVIATGLGGKGNKLRFFIVFISNLHDGLSDYQNEMLLTELKFVLDNNSGELEQMEVGTKYIKCSVLLPISDKIQTIFSGVIDECNQYGNFLKRNFLVTNVKIFSDDEIDSLMKGKT
jgi:hypothetical protein